MLDKINTFVLNDLLCIVHYRVSDLYSLICDEELDGIVTDVHRIHPNTGYKLIHGHLKSRGVRVPSKMEEIGISCVLTLFTNI